MEIFGCTSDAEDPNFSLGNFPVSIRAAAATYYGDKIVVCGGSTCEEAVTQVTSVFPSYLSIIIILISGTIDAIVYIDISNVNWQTPGAGNGIQL